MRWREALQVTVRECDDWEGKGEARGVVCR
jgi:hypothetical protein